MDDDIFTGVEALAQALTVRGPMFLELRSRRADVADRQMQPFHAATLNLGAEIGDGEQEELVRLDQCDDRLGVPGFDGVEVFGEIARPGNANAWRSCLPGAKVMPI